ncbi:adenylate kinase [Candidatus Aerophobetes bacterium]|uniref:Adenylate kinase n=1 Tax=Aerophobetes bacterium TaxID=2030807 RepID=A0A2A4X0V3_UNCAE|nr:MAG: adenylate kinase [Candidatus Aerophobetes bacterium]
MLKSKGLPPALKTKFKAILIFGPPGSGKGTMGKFLSSAGNHFHLSSGDIFRGLSPESPSGVLYHQYASQGKLLPDHVTIQIWYNYVSGLIATNKYFPSQQLLLLDGIPRTVEQVNILSHYVDVKTIILLKAKDDQTLIKRIQRRALIEKRLDDQDSEVLKKRLEVYLSETEPLLDHFPSKIIHTFNALQSPLDVLKDILIELSSDL